MEEEANSIRYLAWTAQTLSSPMALTNKTLTSLIGTCPISFLGIPKQDAVVFHLAKSAGVKLGHAIIKVLKN